jgi:hypothetical protein
VNATGDPDRHVGRKRDLRASGTAASAARYDGASLTGIIMRRPLIGAMSIFPTGVGAKGTSGRAVVA